MDYTYDLPEKETLCYKVFKSGINFVFRVSIDKVYQQLIN